MLLYTSDYYVAAGRVPSVELGWGVKYVAYVADPGAGATLELRV